MTEIERLKKELKEAKADNQMLQLQLQNVTLLLRNEMKVSDTLRNEAAKVIEISN